MNQHDIFPFSGKKASTLRISRNFQNESNNSMRIKVHQCYNHNPYRYNQTDLLSNLSVSFMDREKNAILRMVQNNVELEYLQFQQYRKIIAESKMRLLLDYNYASVSARALDRVMLSKITSNGVPSLGTKQI